MAERAGNSEPDAVQKRRTRRSTYFLTYLGHFEVEAALDRYIENVDVVSTVTRVPIVAGACEWKGLPHIRTQEIGCENSIAPAILKTAEAIGITGSMKPPFTKQFDTFPLEELYHG